MQTLDHVEFEKALNLGKTVQVGGYSSVCPVCKGKTEVQIFARNHRGSIYLEGFHRCQRCGLENRRVEKVGFQAAYLAFIGATKGTL
ncbi:MAG: hypothetical protein ACW976_06835 [Candidatus Ranarchaeia archaeon]|jgi:hypothetical protein